MPRFNKIAEDLRPQSPLLHQPIKVDPIAGLNTQSACNKDQTSGIYKNLNQAREEATHQLNLDVNQAKHVQPLAENNKNYERERLAAVLDQERQRYQAHA
jgi:hypothetical protein